MDLYIINSTTEINGCFYEKSADTQFDFYFKTVLGAEIAISGIISNLLTAKKYSASKKLINSSPFFLLMIVLCFNDAASLVLKFILSGIQPYFEYVSVFLYLVFVAVVLWKLSLKDDIKLCYLQNLPKKLTNFVSCFAWHQSIWKFQSALKHTEERLQSPFGR